MLLPLLTLALAAPTELTLVASVRDGLEHDAYEALLEAFEAEHPDLDVQLVSVQWQGWDAHDTFLRMGALEDAHVDVMLLDTPWVPELARPGWLRPLDDAVDASVFVPAALQGGRYDGRLYGVPLSLKGNVLYYRRDLLEAAGLAVPRTLDELSMAAAAMVGRVDVPLALHHDYLHNDLLPLLAAAGGGFERDGRPILDDPANVATLEVVQGWFQGKPALTGPARWAATAGDYTAPDRWLGEGRAAFLVSWSTRWQLAQGEGSPVAGRIGVTALPGRVVGSGASNLGSWHLAVAAASQHPDEALELVRFLTSERSQRTLLTTLGEVPSRQALLDDPGLRTAHPQLEVLAPALQRAVVRPRVGSQRQVAVPIEAALHAIVDGAPVAATLAAAQEQVAPHWDGPLPDEAPPPVWPGPPAVDVPPAGAPLVLTLALTGGLLLALLILLRVGEARRWRWLESLRPRMMLLGGTAVLGIALVQSGLAASLMLRQQTAELRTQHDTLRRQLEAQALVTAKDLSLAASLVYDPDEPAALEQLLLASHFTEALVGLQLLDPAGAVALDSEQGLFRRGDPAPVPADVVARASRASVQVRARDDLAEPVVEVLAPVVAGGVHVGTLRALVSQAAYLQAVAEVEARHTLARRTQLWGTAGSTFAVMAFGLLGIVWLSRRLTDPILELTGHAARIRAGDLEVRIQSRSRDEVGQLANTMAGMVEGLRDRDFVRDTFGRYLTPALAEQLLSDPDALALGGSLQRVTILMSDLRGFTAMSERLGPQGTVQVLNTYLGRMTEVIVAEGGTIDEFLGDAILVLFGAPVAAPDDALRAARCAVRMQEALAGLNAERVAAGRPPLEMGIGLCTGDVVAGNIGSEQRAKYGVVGDPVNTAARVEGLTVGGQVLLAASTARALGAAARLRGPHEVAVKGKAEPLEVYELLAVDGQAPPQAAAEAWAAFGWPVTVERLLGKRLGDDAVPGDLVARSGRRVRLRTALALAVFDDVRMVADEGEALYGKVIAGSDDGTVVVQLTAGTLPAP